jgi:AraC-like DNA-binding protein/ligand-binding sensor protein
MFRNMEYVFSDEMLKLLDHFTSLTEVRIAFFSLDGKELCIGKNRSICGYCAMRRRSKAFHSACLADDELGRRTSLDRGGVHFYRCHAGLCEAVMPVRVGNVPIGYAMIGQFRLAGTRADAQSGTHRQALAKLPEFTPEKVDDLLSMFEVLIHHIANHALVGRRDFDLLNPLIDRMRSDPAEVLSLPEAARFVGLSPSRLSHLFTAMMGISFKRYQMAQRIERAERLMRSHPEWRMGRIAEACGFEDPLYFSRAYRKHRGRPPSEFLRTA